MESLSVVYYCKALPINPTYKSVSSLLAIGYLPSAWLNIGLVLTIDDHEIVVHLVEQVLVDLAASLHALLVWFDFLLSTILVSIFISCLFENIRIMLVVNRPIAMDATSVI